MSVEEATLRTVMAIKNKYVTILGNPTGRLLFEREGYPIKMKQVIDAASDYSKAIEINSHPMRLDLEWRFLKYGKEKGVKIITLVQNKYKMTLEKYGSKTRRTKRLHRILSEVAAGD